MSKYTELVNQLAEEMGISSHKKVTSLGILPENTPIENFVKMHELAAEVAVKFGAKMFEEGYKQARKLEVPFGDGYGGITDSVKSAMNEIGLIPDQLPDAGKEIEKEVGDGKN